MHLVKGALSFRKKRSFSVHRENPFSKAMLWYRDGKSEFWWQKCLQGKHLPLAHQYLPNSIITIYYEGCCFSWCLEILGLRGRWKSTKRVPCFTSFSINCLFASLSRARKLFFILLVHSCCCRVLALKQGSQVVVVLAGAQGQGLQQVQEHRCSRVLSIARLLNYWSISQIPALDRCSSTSKPAQLLHLGLLFI